MGRKNECCGTSGFFTGGEDIFPLIIILAIIVVFLTCGCDFKKHQ